MKLKDTFITHENDGEHILIDVTSSFVGLVRSTMHRRMYLLQNDVESIVEKLCGIGAIEE